MLSTPNPQPESLDAGYMQADDTLGKRETAVLPERWRQADREKGLGLKVWGLGRGLG